MNFISADEFDEIWEESIGKSLKCLNKDTCAIFNGMSEKSEELYIAAGTMSSEEILKQVEKGSL